MSVESSCGRLARGERGQVIVLFALLVPVIFAIGSIVMGVGNWYVLKRHLQTQVDAAALAGGAVANGCQVNTILVRDKMRLEALKYAGDTTRAAGPFNQQLEQQDDVRVVFNSTDYWGPGDPTDGSTHDWSATDPCTSKQFEVKATDYRLPALISWIPLYPSVKARAMVELRKTKNTNGVRPIGVPEFDPVRVAALFVDEGVSRPTNPNSISGAGFINQQTLPSGDPLEQWNVWRGDVPGVNLNNTSNHSVVILASRDPNVCITPGGPCGNGSLEAVCNQDPVQTRCFGGGGLNDGLSFIHIYAGLGGGATQANPPVPRDVILSGGCPSDLSRPYFNLDGVDVNGNGCTVTVTADIDFGTGGADPTDYPECAVVDIAGGSSMTWVSGQTWVGSYTFPTDAAGRYLMDLDWETDRGGGNCNGQKWSGTIQDAQGAYVADGKADVVEYLKLENAGGPPPIDANSWPKTVSATVRVTVGFTPPLRDLPLTSPPIRLRFEKGPSQTQTLDCGSGSQGWAEKMEVGCDPYQVNERTPTVNCSPPDLLTPPDCIASQNGQFNQNKIRDLWANPCTPNNWDGVTVPPDTDPRWVPLFILDERSTTVSGKKYYPVRRFGGFYVTAGDGIDTGGPQNQCPGNNPSSTRRLELWGHFITYFNPGFGETIPDDELCPFNDASLCVLSLVE